MRTFLEQPQWILSVMRDVADSEIMPRFRTLASHEINEKRPGDLVTVADRDSERAFARRLPELLPGSVVLGEEGFEDDPSTLKVLAGDAPVWIVDPVDGTYNFAHGKTPFTVIVAYIERGETLGGWIIDPVAGDAVWAVRGKGASYQDGAGIRPARVAARPFTDKTITAGPKLEKRLRKASSALGTPLPKVVGRFRCVGREYMDMVTGRVDMARYGGRLKPWDHAAGCLIVREAGGRADLVGSGQAYEPKAEIVSDAIAVINDEALWGPFSELMAASDGPM